MPYRASTVVPDAEPARFRVGSARFNTAAWVLGFSGNLALFVAIGTGYVRLWMILLQLIVHVVGMTFKVCPFVGSLDVSRDRLALGILGWRRTILISQIGKAYVHLEPRSRAREPIAVVRISMRAGEVVDVPIGRTDWFLKRATAIVERIDEAVAVAPGTDG